MRTSPARLLVLLALAACSKPADDASTREGEPATPAGAPAPAGSGRIIEVRTVTDEKGNYFEPNRIEAHEGDVLRLVNVSGVHNMHFLPDSNPSGAQLPPASDMLQLPGQTIDVPVTMKEGKYYFQCDPHAALGMVGHLEVED
jgi:plastocyanin